MKFNCYFCQKEMKPLENKSSFPGINPRFCECQCPYHAAEIHHSYDLRDDNNYGLRRVSITKEFNGDFYDIFLMKTTGGGIPVDTLELGLWGEIDKTNPKNIYQILYNGPIPPDLSPENCADFIQRILNLKAFL